MKGVFAAAVEIQEFLRGAGAKFCFIEAVVLRQQPTLDWKLVFDELEPLVALREAPEVLDRLRRLRQA